jgi:hypothetical protein
VGNSRSAQQGAGGAGTGALTRTPLVATHREPRMLGRVRNAYRFDSVRHTFFRSASSNTCSTAAPLSAVANFEHRTVRKGPLSAAELQQIIVRMVRP